MKLFNLFKRKPKISVTTTSRDRERLTEYERNIVLTRSKEYYACPDCENGLLLDGPRGGCSVNMTCNNSSCGTRLNVTWLFSSQPEIIDRISDKSPLALVR